MTGRRRLGLSMACGALMLLGAGPTQLSNGGPPPPSSTHDQGPPSTPDGVPLPPHLAVQVRSLQAVRAVLERVQWRHDPPVGETIVTRDVAACKDETWRAYRQGWRPFQEEGRNDVSTAEALAPIVVRGAIDQLRSCMRARGYLLTPAGVLDQAYQGFVEAQGRESRQAAVPDRRLASKTPADIAAATLPSVALLMTADARGLMAQASGFVVLGDLVATNFHVVAGAVRVWARAIGRPPTSAVAAAGVVAADEANDLVLVKIPGFRGPPLRLADDARLRVGDPVYVVGNPQGLEGTFSAGTVSAIRTTGRDRVVLQITAPVSAGSSGAPVLDSRGEVVGVVMALLREGQNLNFAVPVSKVKRLLETAGPVAAFPPALQAAAPRLEERSPTPERPRGPLVYFMVPPWGRPTTPLGAQWQRSSTYDTAAECEQERTLARKEGLSLVAAAKRAAAAALDVLTPRDVAAWRRILVETGTDVVAFRRRLHLSDHEPLGWAWFYFVTVLSHEQADAGQCVASDDPQLLRGAANKE